MKNYLITVNGTTYEVQVEETDAVAVQTAPAPRVSAPRPAAPAAKPAPAAAPAPAAPAAATGKTTIKCPMPGNIVKINVAVGDTVKQGSILCILEAMKMENEIVSPEAGVIASINTTQGATVNSGDVLFSIS